MTKILWFSMRCSKEKRKRFKSDLLCVYSVNSGFFHILCAISDKQHGGVMFKLVDKYYLF